VIGQTLSHYRITAAIGAGGMGEVFRATDTQLGRDVALKVLPAAFATDAERLARFEREAKLLASLNHPNIAHVYGFEKATRDDGSAVHFLAMELVEGDELAERMKRGPIPVDETIVIAMQIAEALEEAHEKGIVHRDLKPGNIKLTPDGKVKVLDFGLAKAYAGDRGSGSSPDLSHSPTLAHTGTAAGLILGTAAYMSPEQARGKAVDKKADIWAFGVVLWEMLTGRRLFEGETVSDILAAVLTMAPDLDALPMGVPSRVRRLLEHCLRKDPKQRLHDIADARIELSEAGDEVTAPAEVRSAPRQRNLVPWAVTALMIGLAAWALLGPDRAAPPARPLKVSILPPSGTTASGPVDISRDGRQIAFTASAADGRARLYVRDLDALEPRAIPGTEGANAPFFSPDGRSVGFFAERKLKRVDLAGGPARELADAPDHRGGSWGTQNLIVFAPGGGGAIYRVPVAGGAAAPVTAIDPAALETSHRWPRFLPDGKRFLFLSRKPQPPGRLAVEVGSVEGGLRTRLVESSTSGAFARGRLYFTRETTLLSQALDEGTLAVSGEPVPVADDVWRDPNTDGLTAFSVAEGGTLVYRRGGLALSQLTWLDREGKTLGTLGAPAIIGDVSLSADGRRALVDLTDAARDVSSLFVLDGATGRSTRLTFGAGNQSSCLYSPDGRQFVFGWDAKGPFDMFRQGIDGTGEPEPLLTSPVWKFPETWSPDGRFLAFTQDEPGKPRNLWILPLTGEAKPFPFTQTNAEEWAAAFSPDGRFLAYVSDESGRSEVFIRTFPASPGKWQVSSGGGTSPAWGRDGKELFYVGADGAIVAVPIALSARGLEPGIPRPLFRLAALKAATGWGATPFDVAADGRFLANVYTSAADASPIVLHTISGGS
jgi:eukaryotic-like serine/threonine-protein kinase